MANKKIIIIGSGTSGISAGSDLIEKGFKNVEIFEAESRIGGRLYTTLFGKSTIDLGAQWCHGQVNNSVYNLVKDYDLLDKTVLSYPKMSFINSAGHEIAREKSLKLVKLYSEIIKNSTEELKTFNGSLGSYFVGKYQEALQTPEYADIDPETAYDMLDYFHKFENSIEASDSWYDASGRGYTEYWECDGYPLLNWKDQGYGSVLNYIMKKKPNLSHDLRVEEKIQFNKEVCNICWDSTDVVVKCSDGTSHRADHVIITVSLGVLKENHKNLFTPKLPKYKIDAIEGLSFGTVDKIFLEFDEPFWQKDWNGFALLWRKKDSDEIRKTANAWLEDIFGFWTVDYAPNILLGWISGVSARQMEKLDDTTVMDGCMHLFEKFLGHSMNFTRPIRIKRSNWFTNKHFRGSYSYRGLKTELLGTSAKQLAKPIYDENGRLRILFAGEATSDHFYSTVHGALDSGRREADRIANYYKNRPLQIPRTRVPTEKYFDVIVIGAGIAGLGSGHILKSSNLNFAILEASSRVGGRILTLAMNSLAKNSKIGPKIDAGAQWLHGKNNQLYNYAAKFNLIRPELSEEAEGDYIREDGTKFDEFFVKKIDFKIGQILEECEEYVNHKNDPDFKFPRSLADYVEEKFSNYVKTFETAEEKVQAMQLLDWHKKFQIIDNSCMYFDDISAKDWGNYSFNGESCQTHINVAGGMGKITEYLHSDLHDFIKFNEIVDLVQWKGDELLKNNCMKIICRNGSTYLTNNLVCTIPLGVLKENHLKIFKPPLPEQHQEAIRHIGFGTINKIFFHFDRKWWNDDWKGLQLLWNEDLNESSHWTKYISGFDVAYPVPENTLIGWIGGKGAIDMENLSDQQIASDCLKVMRNFLNQKDIPEPSHFYASRWNSNEFIRGAYSFTSRQTDSIKDWEKILSKPIIHEFSNDDKNMILMAGEACHEQYFSTVHGAFLSGIEQAKNILNFRKYKKTKDNLTFLSKL